MKNCVEVVSAKLLRHSVKPDSVRSHKTNCSSSGFRTSSISNYSSNSNSNSSSNSISSSNYSSNFISSPRPNSEPNPKPKPTYANIKFDITNKVCNKCKDIKQITSFDITKSICKECTSKTVNCEYCSSIISFSGLRSYLKNILQNYILVLKLKAKGIDIEKLLEEQRDKRIILSRGSMRNCARAHGVRSHTGSGLFLVSFCFWLSV